MCKELWRCQVRKRLQHPPLTLSLSLSLSLYIYIYIYCWTLIFFRKNITCLRCFFFLFINWFIHFRKYLLLWLLLWIPHSLEKKAEAIWGCDYIFKCGCNIAVSFSDRALKKVFKNRKQGSPHATLVIGTRVYLFKSAPQSRYLNIKTIVGEALVGSWLLT